MPAPQAALQIAPLTMTITVSGGTDASRAAIVPALVPYAQITFPRRAVPAVLATDGGWSMVLTDGRALPHPDLSERGGVLIISVTVTGGDESDRDAIASGFGPHLDAAFRDGIAMITTDQIADGWVMTAFETRADVFDTDSDFDI